MLVFGFCVRTAFIQVAKCAAPPSDKSSRVTEVITTYFKFIRATASDSLIGSAASRGCGMPGVTLQKWQLRVQVFPMIIKVAVPQPKHSPKFGQAASSHTVANLFWRSICLMPAISGLHGHWLRIQGGLRGLFVLIGINYFVKFSEIFSQNLFPTSSMLTATNR